METIVLPLPLTILAPQILNHFAFGKAKAANWEIKGTRIFKLVPVRNRNKSRRSEENREENFVSCLYQLSPYYATGFVQPLLQNIYLISYKGEEV